MVPSLALTMYESSSLVRILFTEINESVPVLAYEDVGDQAGNRDILLHVVQCIGRIDPGLIGRKKRPR
jgi:hypothetical protein